MTDFEILKGKTFSRVIRWETLPLIYKSITAISNASPVAITAVGHGLVNGWSVAVVSAGGMRQINAKNWPLRNSDFHKATVSTADFLTLNDVNSANYSTYTSGGSIVYYTPVSLAGFSARMQIRATAASENALVSLVSPTHIVIDDTLKTITITIAATDTDDYDFTTGVYDLEMVSGDATPVVTRLLSGNITVTEEVTR